MTLVKIFADKNKRTVTAIIRNSRQTVVSTAYCSPTDEFSVEKGRGLALARAKARMNRANIVYYRKMMNSHLKQAEKFSQMMLQAEAKQILLDDAERQVYERLSNVHQENKKSHACGCTPTHNSEKSHGNKNKPIMEAKVVVGRVDQVLDAILGSVISGDIAAEMARECKKHRHEKNAQRHDHYRSDVRSVKHPRGAQRHR